MNSFKYSYKTKKEDSILINVYNSGYQKCESGYGVGPVVKNTYLIHHVVSGKGYYVVDSRTYEINEGDTFIIYPNKVVSYYADKESPWEYYWVGFGGADVKTLISKTDFSAENPVIHTDQVEQLKDILLKIFSSSGSEFSNHIAMVGYLYLFLSLLIKCSSKRDVSADISLVYIKNAVNFITENYEKKISVENVATVLGISRSHLYRIFMRHIGQSPKSYIEHYRMKQGCTLLTQTALTISEVSNSVGYDDQLHFSKAFKKIIGISPKEYRKQNEKTHENITNNRKF